MELWPGDRITLTDSDANTNSLDTETLSVTDVDRIIPTIRIGAPFTLAEANSVKLGATVIGAYATDISDILVLAGDNNNYGVDDELIIDIGTRNDVNAHLPQNHTKFVGTHLLNYDVSSLDNVGSHITPNRRGSAYYCRRYW